MLKHKGYNRFEEFEEDFRSIFKIISPNRMILSRCSHLKDVSFTRSGGSRVVGTPDAIQLLTCLHVQQDMGVEDIIFHTLDEGKAKGWEGKCVPLIGFENWTPADGISKASRSIVDQIILLPRLKPMHPQPNLLWSCENEQEV
jgi:hypothetical protein